LPLGIDTAADLQAMPSTHARQLLTVVGERTVFELGGTWSPLSVAANESARGLITNLTCGVGAKYVDGPLARFASRMGRRRPIVM